MFHHLRSELNNDEGFTLIELLVVILIIGILAAIAIPSFLNQRYKGQDACAKSMVKQMQTASKTFQTDNSTVIGMSLASLSQIEQTITGSTSSGACSPSGTSAIGSIVSTTGTCDGVNPTLASTFCVSATSLSGNSFSISESGGGVSRACTIPAAGNAGGCKASPGSNGSW